MKPKIVDWIMERAVWLCGLLILLMVATIGFYLAAESKYAFDRTFPYGYRFALQAPGADAEEDINFDPYATLLTANIEGSDGLDEKEETMPLPTLDELRDSSPFATGSVVSVEGDAFYSRDNWKAAKRAEKGDRFALFAFATPEHQEPTMRLAWAPDSSYAADSSAYDIRLRLVRAPEGINSKPLDVDLVAQPKGSIELETYIAKTDDDRTKGYVFEMVATPKQSSLLGTIAGLIRSDWEPTNPYPRFGFIPLLFSTLLMTFVAMLIAAPGALLTSIYLSEIASPRLREWLKPIIELLASVPTVVLAYFGLMLVAPGLVEVFGEAAGMSSGRSMLTASLVLAVLILPIMISIAEDALRSVPRALRDAPLALGFSASESIRKVLVPAARSGLVAALLLGFARAVGETMIVWILAGGTVSMPKLSSPAASLAQPSRGVPDTIAIEMGNVVFEAPHYGHLFLLGLILFGLTLAINLTGYFYARRQRWQA